MARNRTGTPDRTDRRTWEQRNTTARASGHDPSGRGGDAHGARGDGAHDGHGVGDRGPPGPRLPR
jgi:hypothetical protein